MPVVFIHGVTVREERWGPLLDDVSAGIRTHRADVVTDGVYWGDLASELRFGGASIPGFVDGSRGSEDDEAAELTAALLDDPYLELQLLAGEPDDEGAITELADDSELHDRNDTLEAAVPGIQRRLTEGRREIGREDVDERAIAAMVRHSIDVAEQAPASWSVDDLVDPLVRALTAALYVEAVGPVPLDVAFEWTVTKRFVQKQVEDELAARGLLIRTAAVVVTASLRRGGRRRLMGMTSLFIGDVLRYMSHREQIQARVAETVEALCERADDDLWLVGHSLGGIIAFEYCQETSRDVARLVTVGSQVGLLAEMGALRLEPTLAKFTRPERVASWLNIYDPDDILSFLAAPVFGGVKDIEIDTGAPFPLSHSEYWTCAPVYAAFADV